MFKKGFTLIELLAVIIIIAIILVIAITGANNAISNTRINSFIANEQIMVNIVRYYFVTNSEYLPTDIGDTVEIKLGSLQAKGLISAIRDPWNLKNTCNGYILVTKISNKTYDYDPYLKCTDNYIAGGYVEDALTAYWKFDGNAYDYTPNDNHGVIQNATTTTNRFGVQNKALAFNGPSNFVNTNYDYSINYNTSTTFSLWVKFSTIDTGGKVKNIFGKNSWEYLLSQVDNKVHFTVWNSSGDYAIKLISKTNIEIGKWYNIILVYDATNNTFYLYINGTLDTYGTTSSINFANKNESLKIGRGFPDSGAAASTFFLGSIDSLYIYNRAFSEHEVKLNYDVYKIVSK